MITVYRDTPNGLEAADHRAESYWIQVEAPEDDEIDRLRDEFGVPDAFLDAALDLREVARTFSRDGKQLIVIRTPRFFGLDQRVPYRTVPVGIVVTPDHFLTISPTHTDLANDLNEYRADWELEDITSNQLILSILAVVSERYLHCLEDIDAALEEVEERLAESIENSEMLEVLKYEKSLVHLTAGLKWNDEMMQHLARLETFNWRAEDLELLEDARTEHNQAYHIAEILQTTLGETMDAFASIISNNLNVVMKFLAAASIVLSMLAVVISLFSVNYPVPGEDNPTAFILLVGGALVIGGAVTYYLYRRGMFSMWTSGK